MSGYGLEDSDFLHEPDSASEEEVLEDDGEDTSDCESVYLGDRLPEAASEDPPVSTHIGDGNILRDEPYDSPPDYDDAEADYLPPSLDSTPSFDPIRSPFEPHLARAYVPSSSEMNRQSPLSFFKLFVSDQEFELFAANTNAYAESKNAIPKIEPRPRKPLPCEPPSNRSKRPWHPTNAREIMTWFGILIFMGLVKIPRVNLYWRDNGEYSFSPMKQMSLKRFEQLKRYFHLSAPDRNPAPSKSAPQPWYSKIELFGKAIRNGSSKHFLPATEVSNDEMMVRFIGRSCHIIKIKNKPIKQGYKIFALCWHGFTYTYLYSSRTKKIGGVQKLAEHSLTSSAVIHLAKCLPYKEFRFDIYMDNYFTNIPLFAHLRALGIGAAALPGIHQRNILPRLQRRKSPKARDRFGILWRGRLSMEFLR